MRRHVSIALASAILALAVAGFVSGAGPSVAWSEADRAVTSPLVELQAIPATGPRVDTLAALADAAALLTAWTIVLVAAGVGYVVRERRRRIFAAVPVWSASLRGPPRLAIR